MTDKHDQYAQSMIDIKEELEPFFELAKKEGSAVFDTSRVWNIISVLELEDNSFQVELFEYLESKHNCIISDQSVDMGSYVIIHHEWYLDDNGNAHRKNSQMLDYCERCNSSLPEHLCENCGQTTCHDCFGKECIKLSPTNEIMTKLWKLRENARALRPHFKKFGYDIKYSEGYEQDDIIPRWYTSYAWILCKSDINIELHMSSSQYGNRAVFSIWIWKGVIPNLLVSKERLDFISWKKVRVLSYLEELEYMNLIAHLNTIVEVLT